MRATRKISGGSRLVSKCRAREDLIVIQAELAEVNKRRTAIEEQLADKNPRAILLSYHVGVLSKPT